MTGFPWKKAVVSATCFRGVRHAGALSARFWLRLPGRRLCQIAAEPNGPRSARSWPGNIYASILILGGRSAPNAARLAQGPTSRSGSGTVAITVATDKPSGWAPHRVRRNPPVRTSAMFALSHPTRGLAVSAMLLVSDVSALSSASATEVCRPRSGTELRQLLSQMLP